VTVCVAEIAQARSLLNPCIVLASDKEVGIGDVTAEIAKKQDFLSFDWNVMIAGDDVAPAMDIRRYARTEMQNSIRRKEHLSLDRVIAIVREAVCKRRLEIIEAICLMPIGWTLEEFRSRAGQTLPEHIYAGILHQMHTCDLPTIELLVSGFDHLEVPHLFTIGWDGIERVHDDLGFYAIGSGQRNALTMLFYRKVNKFTPLNDALYFAFEAKAAGESAPGVGTETDMRVQIPNHFRGERLSDNEIAALRLIYNTLKPRDLDVNQRQSINDFETLARMKHTFDQRVQRSDQSEGG